MNTTADRFWAKVTRDREDGCWEWTGGMTSGYGRFFVGGQSRPKQVGAHRWAYQHLIGPIPDGLQLDHLCRNRACVNPAHLEPVSQRVNVLRGEGLSAKQARQTHCRHGHEFTPENTRMAKGRKRHCRQCQHYRNISHKFLIALSSEERGAEAS